MLQFRSLPAVVLASRNRRFAKPPTQSPAALLAPLAMLAFVACFASTAGAQSGNTSGTPLHLATDRFDFVASGDTPPAAKLLRVHNGGTARFTDVRITKLTYADSAHGAAWLVSLPRQTTVAPDELATVGTLCVDATGLAAGTYHAKAAVSAREVPEPVAFTITLVVKEGGTGTRQATARCGTGVTK